MREVSDLYLDLDDVLVGDALRHLLKRSKSSTGSSQAQAQEDESLHGEIVCKKKRIHNHYFCIQDVFLLRNYLVLIVFKACKSFPGKEPTYIHNMLF